jgi:hypothetical protein
LLPTLAVPCCYVTRKDAREIVAVSQGISAAEYDPDEPWEVCALEPIPKAVRDWDLDAEAPEVGHSERVVDVVDGPKDLPVIGAVGDTQLARGK